MENTNKPFGEWTLDEAQAECDAHNDDCNGCKLLGVTCDLSAIRAPYNWGLEGKRDEVAATDTDAARKPRLAEVLGVEVGERFTIFGFAGCGEMWIDEDGFLVNDGKTNIPVGALTIAINCPEHLDRAPRLTEAELAICKAVGAKWVERDEDGNPWAKLWDEKPDVEVDGDNGRCYYSESGACLLALVDGNIFKSVRPGECICAEEASGE